MQSCLVSTLVYPLCKFTWGGGGGILWSSHYYASITSTEVSCSCEKTQNVHIGLFSYLSHNSVGDMKVKNQDDISSGY